MNNKSILILLLSICFLARVQCQTSKPYLVADFAEEDLPTMLQLCHWGGFEMLVEQNPFVTFGHYEWNPSFAPEGHRSVKRMVEAAQAEGVQLGLLVQKDAISLNDAFFAPKYFKQYQRSEQMALFDDLTVEDVDITLRRNDSFESYSALNLLMIDDEMVSIGTLELTGDLVLLHHCRRGLYGTKQVAHDLNSKVFQIREAPGRCVAPDGALLEQVRQQLANRLAEAEVPFLIYKGGPGQELLGESIRVRQVERWENEGLANNTLGWFLIHAADERRQATTLEDLEWMLSKSIAFDASFNLLLDKKAIKEHGRMEEMLKTIRMWYRLYNANFFTDTQIEDMRDPYADWHLEQTDDLCYMLSKWNFSRRYRCEFVEVDSLLIASEKWEWKADKEGRFGLRIQVGGEVPVKNPMVDTENGWVMFPCTIEPGQCLVYNFYDYAYLMDANFNKLKRIEIEGVSELPKGVSEVCFLCDKPTGVANPVVTLRYITCEKAEEDCTYKW